MNIGIDFDDTYTKDSKMWNRIIEIFLESGHNVYCTTARCWHNMEQVHNSIGKLITEENCIPTCEQGKKEFIWNYHNIWIDIWIDDMPEAIVWRPQVEFRRPMTESDVLWKWDVKFWPNKTKNK